VGGQKKEAHFFCHHLSTTVAGRSCPQVLL
jgi:hypothetical protein